MKQIYTALFSLLILVSCGTAPAPEEKVPPVESPQSAVPETPSGLPQTTESAVTETAPPEESPPGEELAPPEESGPAPEETPAETNLPETAPAGEENFDPASITQAKFDAVKSEVEALIKSLNGIIKARNYNAWRGYLADSYFERISAGEFLDERTEELYRRDQVVASNLRRDPRRVQKKILKTPKDYFDNIVVPSRSNDRLDDISFVSEDRVKAYTVNNRGQRLVLYDFGLIDGTWKIIN